MWIRDKISHLALNEQISLVVRRIEQADYSLDFYITANKRGPWYICNTDPVGVLARHGDWDVHNGASDPRELEEQHTPTPWSILNITYGSTVTIRGTSIGHVVIDVQPPNDIYHEPCKWATFDIECTYSEDMDIIHETQKHICSYMKCSCGYILAITSILIVSKESTNDGYKYIPCKYAPSIFTRAMVDHRPRFIVAHNGSNFDCRVLCEMIMSGGVNHETLWYFREVNTYDNRNRGVLGVEIVAPGMTFVDSLVFIKRTMDSQLKGYGVSLKGVSTYCRDRYGDKFPIEPKSECVVPFTINLSIEDAMVMHEYNAYDVEVTTQCMNTLGFTGIIERIIEITGCSPHAVVYSLKSKFTVSCVHLLTLRRYGKVIRWSAPDAKFEKHYDMIPTGGNVLSAVPCIKSNVVVRDFNSAYPRMMLLFCPSALLHRSSTDCGDSMSVMSIKTPYGYIEFLTVHLEGNLLIYDHKGGLLGPIVEFMLNERSRVGKNTLMGTTWKIIVNSLYGSFALYGTPFFSPMTSGCITFGTRYCQRGCEGMVAHMGIVMGDTDSIGHMLDQSIMRRLDEPCSVTDPYFQSIGKTKRDVYVETTSKAYTIIMGYMGVSMNLGVDAVYDLMVVYRKKHYSMMLNSKVLHKGVSAVRRDSIRMYRYAYDAFCMMVNKAIKCVNMSSSGERNFLLYFYSYTTKQLALLKSMCNNPIEHPEHTVLPKYATRTISSESFGGKRRYHSAKYYMTIQYDKILSSLGITYDILCKMGQLEMMNMSEMYLQCMIVPDVVQSSIHYRTNHCL